jgi:catabolite regulation protein CreA
MYQQFLFALALSCGTITVAADQIGSVSTRFKSMQVVRFFDARRNVLVYLTYSDRIIEGSPKNSISVVPIQPRPGASPQAEGATAR